MGRGGGGAQRGAGLARLHRLPQRGRQGHLRVPFAWRGRSAWRGTSAARAARTGGRRQRRRPPAPCPRRGAQHRRGEGNPGPRPSRPAPDSAARLRASITPEDPAAQVWSSRTGFAETAPVPVPSSGAALCPRGEPGGDGSPSPGPGGHPPRPRHHAGPVASRSRPPHARCRGRRRPGSGPRPSWPAAASARRGATPKEGPAPRVRPGRPTPATARGPARTLLRDSKKAAFHPCTGVARDGLPRTRTCGWVRVRWRCCGR